MARSLIHSRFLPAFIAASLAVLTSCVGPYAVWVVPGAQTTGPAFGLARKRGGTETETLAFVAVYRCFGRKFATLDDAVWYIEATGGENALKRLTYGVAPPGFTAPKPAPRLQEGECYDITASGSGVEGGTKFRVLAGGALTELSDQEQRAMADSAFAREVAFGEAAVRMCQAAYHGARDRADTTRVDQLAHRDASGEFGSLDCKFLRSRAVVGCADAKRPTTCWLTNRCN